MYMTDMEKYIVKRKLKAIIKHFKKEGQRMNKQLLCSKLNLSYPTLLKIFSDKKKNWTLMTRTKLIDYIDKFEQENGQLLIDLF